MRRLPLISFGALVLATVAAFFVTQHLKVTTPLLAGFPRPVPGVIDPYGASCGRGQNRNHSAMRISFYLLHRSDVVDVYIVNSDGTIVRTLALGVHMGIKHRRLFVWNGRDDNGSVVADGTYYVRVALRHQGRTVDISNSSGPEPVKVLTIPPHPVVTSVTPTLIPLGHTPVSIHFSGTEHRSGTVVLYRTDVPGRPQMVKRFKTAWGASQAKWDGLINKLPAPAGTYLVGLDVTDAACNVGKFPPLMPPVPGSTVHAGVTVRYLAAEPPLTPVPAGSTTVVYVDARGQGYRWSLTRVGSRKPSAHGAQAGYQLRIRLPRGPGAGLYELAISSGSGRTSVPIVAGYPSPNNRPHVLVVLPALTWQGQNPVDDPPQDGLPNTLSTGGPVELSRVFANGLPADLAGEAALLTYLDKTRLPYDLTTDLALIDGVGPRLSGHTGVVLAGTEQWTTSALDAELRAYVQDGGHLLSLGVGSLLRAVTVRGGSALRPRPPATTDPLAARPGPLTTSSGLITVIEDRLRIFTGTAGAFQGYRTFQPIDVVAPAKLLSAAGDTTTRRAIVGYGLGRGFVVDVGLSGFGATLSHNLDARELVGRLWQLLRR